MQKVISFGLSLIMISSLFAGCGQATPKAEVPSETTKIVQAEPITNYQVPDTFQGEWTGVNGFLHVTADASINTPYGVAVPVATVRKRRFTQEDADRILDAFLGDAELYLYNPDDAKAHKASRTLSSDEHGGTQIDGWADVDSGELNLKIWNPVNCHSLALVGIEPYANLNWPIAEHTDTAPDIRPEEAMAAAEELLDQLGLHDFVCLDPDPIVFLEQGSNLVSEDGTALPKGKGFDTGYNLCYVRSVEDFPIAFLDNTCGTATPDNERIDDTWAYEWIRISVNSAGEVVFFRWESPYEDPEIVTENADLLPWSEIAALFPQLIMTVNSRLVEINAINGFDVVDDYQVDKVELNLMRIRDKYNYEEGTLVPVWDFWATTSAKPVDDQYRDLVYDGSYYKLVLTINALDGTVIDRDLGY